MQKSLSWPKVLIILGICVAILLPLTLYVVRTPIVLDTVHFPTSRTHQVSNHFSAESQVPGMTMTLNDTAFLEYTAQNLGMFEQDAVVDPRFVYNQTNAATKYTVSRVKFLLVPRVSRLFYSVWGKDNLASMGDYSVDGNTLIISVSLDPKQITGGPAGKFYLENDYLLTALSTICYAREDINHQLNRQALSKITSDIQTYLLTGLMPWPIKITQNQ